MIQSGCDKSLHGIPTISPFKFIGGSHDTMIFVFDAGIALISFGADGTANKNRRRSINVNRNPLCVYFTIFVCSAKKLFGFDAVADFSKCQNPNTVVGVLLQIFHSQILIR